MFIRVCVSYIFICLCVFVFPLLHSQSQPRQTLFSHYRVSFFFFSLTYIYRQKNQSLSYCMFTSHLFTVNTGKIGGKKRAKKTAHRCIQTLSGSCFKLCFLHWQKIEGSIILASMLWSQNTDTFIILFVFTFVFICSFVLEISPSHFTP